MISDVGGIMLKRTDNDERMEAQILNGDLMNLLSDTILQKAVVYVRRYESETDALLLQKGLLAFRDMLIYANNAPKNISSKALLLMKDELNHRILEINNIIVRARRKRPAPQMSSYEEKLCAEITERWGKLYGIHNTKCIGNVVRFLSESSNSGKK